MKTNNFLEIKETILASARSAQACREQYGRAYSSETPEELMEVIKDNLHWCAVNKVLTVSLIEEYRDLFTEYGIHCNESVDSGYLLADNATVQAWGSAKVEAWGSAKVWACGSATVQAWGSAKVRAWGNAYITSYSSIECSLSDKVIHRIRETNTIRFASDELKFERIYDDRTSE